METRLVGCATDSISNVILRAAPCRVVIPWVREALRREARVRMTVSGSSMLPFLRDGDTIELEAVGSTCRLGDVVLAEVTEGQYLVHRVIWASERTVWLAGDAQSTAQGPLPVSSLLGRVVAIERHGKRIRPTALVRRLCALLWIALLPWRPPLLSWAGWIKGRCRLWRSRLTEVGRRLSPSRP